jgi:hypothetical protein
MPPCGLIFHLLCFCALAFQVGAFVCLLAWLSPFFDSFARTAVAIFADSNL